MTSENIREQVAQSVISQVLKREGGIVQNPGEPYITRFGTTPDWLAGFGFDAPGTPGQAALLYRAWLDKTGLIAVCDVDDALPDIAIDYAVHAGHIRAIRALQGPLGVSVDGRMGPSTAAALAKADRRLLAVTVLAERNVWNGHLITTHPEKFAQDAEGWAVRISQLIRRLV